MTQKEYGEGAAGTLSFAVQTWEMTEQAKIHISPVHFAMMVKSKKEDMKCLRYKQMRW